MRKVLDIDPKGNVLLYEETTVRDVLTRKILLKLKGRIRNIAEIKKHDGEYRLFIKRNRKKHLFKKNRSYGFNDILLKKCLEKDITLVEIVDEKDRWLFPISLILENGDYLFFNQQGFERQIFLKLSVMDEYTINPSQPSLF